MKKETVSSPREIHVAVHQQAAPSAAERSRRHRAIPKSCSPFSSVSVMEHDEV